MKALRGLGLPLSSRAPLTRGDANRLSRRSARASQSKQGRARRSCRYGLRICREFSRKREGDSRGTNHSIPCKHDCRCADRFCIFQRAARCRHFRTATGLHAGCVQVLQPRNSQHRTHHGVHDQESQGPEPALPRSIRGSGAEVVRPLHIPGASTCQAGACPAKTSRQQ